MHDALSMHQKRYAWLACCGFLFFYVCIILSWQYTIAEHGEQDGEGGDYNYGYQTQIVCPIQPNPLKAATNREQLLNPLERLMNSKNTGVRMGRDHKLVILPFALNFVSLCSARCQT